MMISIDRYLQVSVWTTHIPTLQLGYHLKLGMSYVVSMESRSSVESVRSSHRIKSNGKKFMIV